MPANNQLQNLFQDKEGRVVIFQKPNVPIIVWAMSMVIARLTHGEVRDRFELLAFIALATWALMEILWGSTTFRRILGAVVLIVIVVGRFAS
jgi:hypothetical protein